MAETYLVDHVSISVTNLSRPLASSIKDKLCHESPSLMENCIFKVPEKLRRRNGNVFKPNVVSIGPYHRGNKRFATMDSIKKWYLHGLLSRLPLPPEDVLEYIIENMKLSGLHKRAYGFYSDPFNLREDEFIEMLVVDGCFLLELFRKEAYMVPRHRDDPIFNTSWMHENLYHDLILLENQIPWFVLEHLFKQTISVIEQEPTFLEKLALKFFENMMLLTEPAEYIPNCREIRHILDLLRGCILSSSQNREPDDSNLELFPAVTDLLQVGVKFKRGTPSDILNIRFNDGVFEIPPIRIRGNSECLFRNLIAYEQCDPHCDDQFTSYAAVLDCLIDTSKDAALLCDEKIVVRALSTEDVSLLFNRLYNDTLISNFYYGELTGKVNKYYKSQWPRWRTILKRDYFNSPWASFAFAAAVLAMVLTFLQTLFAILSY